MAGIDAAMAGYGWYKCSYGPKTKIADAVVRSPRFYAQFVELVNAIKTRPLFTQIRPLIVSPKSHHHH